MPPKKEKKEKKTSPKNGVEDNKTKLIEKTSSHLLQTRYHGTLMAYGFQFIPTGEEILALVCGDLQSVDKPLVRIHSRCLTGDVFGSAHCDCGQQLDLSLQKMRIEGAGLLIYLEQEGRGAGLVAKLRAYELKETEGIDTVDAYKKMHIPVDSRSYDAAIEIIKYFKIKSLRLLTNNPEKIKPLEESEILVLREDIEISPNEWDIDYLRTKKHRMGHLLNKV